MNRTESGATVVLAMRRQRAKNGQAMVEYAFLMVLLATITFAVILLAGNQLKTAYNDISFEFTHITDASTYMPDGSAVAPDASPPAAACPPGQTLQLRGHKWKCK
jgi:Flp pilus assembly pilin Flp